MADKEQVEENGKGGDVVDGNSQGGKKGKKGEFLEETIWSSQYSTIPGKGGKKKEGGGEAAQQQLSPDQQEKLRQAMEMLSMQNQSAPKSEEDASKKNFQFWSTQPVWELRFREWNFSMETS